MTQPARCTPSGRGIRRCAWQGLWSPPAQDAGTSAPEAGSAPDGGVTPPDAGPPDAGPPDAGPDAGIDGGATGCAGPVSADAGAPVVVNLDVGDPSAAGESCGELAAPTLERGPVQIGRDRTLIEQDLTGAGCTFGWHPQLFE